MADETGSGAGSPSKSRFSMRGSFAGTALSKGNSKNTTSASSSSSARFTTVAEGSLRGGAQDLVVQKQGELSKKSSSMLKGWQRKMVRLYGSSLMWSEKGTWAPKDADMIVLAKVQSLSVKKGGEFEIVETTGGKTCTIKMKADSSEAAEEWVTAITDAQTQDAITSKSVAHGVAPELCAKVPAAERHRLFKEFALHDKDGSGCIDTEEFRGMCKNLGANLSKEEADSAMKELDRDGNGTCDFEEFLWFWSKTPACGGHSTLGLQFLQAKLKAREAMEVAQDIASQRIVAVDSKLDEADDTPIKLGYALNPSGTPPSEAKLSATMTLSKEERSQASHRLLVRLQAEPAGEAARICSELKELIMKYDEQVQRLLGPVDVVEEEGGLVVVTIALRGGDSAGLALGGGGSADFANTVSVRSVLAQTLGTAEGVKQANALGLAVSWLKRWEACLSLNFDFNDMVASPNKGLDVATLLRHKFTVDAVMSAQMKRLILGMIPSFQAWSAAAWRIFAGCQGDVQLAYDSDQVTAIINQLTGGQTDTYLEMTKPAALLEMFKQTTDPMPKSLKEDLRRIRDIMEKLTGVDAVVLDGLPEAPPDAGAVGVTAWKQARIDFIGCNPFPWLRYIMEPIAEGKVGLGGLNKPMSTAERKKLTEVFKTHDKDGNNTLDLKELEDMITELGGKLAKEDLDVALTQLDKNGNGTCDFDEFVAWWTATPGCGGYSSVALEVLKLQMSTAVGFGDLKKNFLTFFPGKDQEGLTFNASVEAVPGMAAIESAKAAVKALLRKASGGWLSAPAPCLEIQLAVPKGEAESVAKAFQQAFDSVGEMLNMLMPKGKWTSQVSKSSTPPCVLITADLTEVLKGVTSDEAFMKILTQVADATSQLELSFAFASEFNDAVSNPSTPVVSLVKGLRVSIKSQITRDGKELMEQALPWLEALLRLIVGVDIAFLFGYHEKYMAEVTLETGTNGKEGVKWFTVDDARKAMEMRKERSGDAPDDIAQALKNFRNVAQIITGIDAISFKNLPIGVTGQDIHVALNNFNPFPLVAYIMQPYLTLSKWPPEGEVASQSSPPTKADDEGGSAAGNDSPGTSAKKAKAKAKGTAKKDAEAPDGEKKAKGKAKARGKSMVKKDKNSSASGA